MGSYLSRQSRSHCTVLYTSCTSLLYVKYIVKGLSIQWPAPVVQGKVGSRRHEVEDTWVVHLWLVNDNVSPPVYLHMPAVVDTGCEEQLLIPLKDAEKLQLAEDTLMTGRRMTDAAHKTTAILTYKPVRVLVPMLNERVVKMHQSSQDLPKKAHSPSAAAADQHIKKAGEQAVAMVGDKSEAWVQTSPTKHPRHDTHSEHALLGLKAMDELGLHLDREQRAIHTHKMRTVRRRNDAF